MTKVVPEYRHQRSLHWNTAIFEEADSRFEEFYYGDIKENVMSPLLGDMVVLDCISSYLDNYSWFNMITTNKKMYQEFGSELHILRRHNKYLQERKVYVGIAKHQNWDDGDTVFTVLTDRDE